MKQITRRQTKSNKPKPTHLIALVEPVHNLGIHTIVNGWEHKVHGHVVCWKFNHPSKGVVDVLPCQIKILKKIITIKKRIVNDPSNKAGDRAVVLSRASRNSQQI